MDGTFKRAAFVNSHPAVAFYMRGRFPVNFKRTHFDRADKLHLGLLLNHQRLALDGTYKFPLHPHPGDAGAKEGAFEFAFDISGAASNARAGHIALWGNDDLAL